MAAVEGEFPGEMTIKKIMTMMTTMITTVMMTIMILVVEWQQWMESSQGRRQ